METMYMKKNFNADLCDGGDLCHVPGLGPVPCPGLGLYGPGPVLCSLALDTC